MQWRPDSKYAKCHAEEIISTYAKQQFKRVQKQLPKALITSSVILNWITPATCLI